MLECVPNDLRECVLSRSIENVPEASLSPAVMARNEAIFVRSLRSRYTLCYDHWIIAMQIVFVAGTLPSSRPFTVAKTAHEDGFVPRHDGLGVRCFTNATRVRCHESWGVRCFTTATRVQYHESWEVLCFATANRTRYHDGLGVHCFTNAIRVQCRDSLRVHYRYSCAMPRQVGKCIASSTLFA